jgi:hypothetical protein
MTGMSFEWQVGGSPHNAEHGEHAGSGPGAERVPSALGGIADRCLSCSWMVHAYEHLVGWR